MSQWIKFGRRKNDLEVMYDFHAIRGMAYADTALVKNAIDLEIIPPGFNGSAPGVVLIHRDWGNFYCLIRREGWDEDAYFEYALKRFEEMGVKKP